MQGIPPRLRQFLHPSLFLLLFLTAGCTSLLTSTVITPTIDNLQKQTDLDLVCEGAPAYLLMIDSMIAQNPGNSDLLQAGAQSYSAYAAALTECGAAATRMAAIAGKARLYGTTLLARSLPINPDATEKELTAKLALLHTGQVPELFWGSLAWLTWIQQQQGAAAAMADLVTLEKIMARLLELDEGYQAGSIHLFFGGYYATRPAMLGGDPEKSKKHFDAALALSQRRFLMIQATYAETYARQVFDRKLHDSLLKEVLAFDLASAPEYALSNQIAKKKAQRLLAEDFFAE
jgi:hypothetical protein